MSWVDWVAVISVLLFSAGVAVLTILFVITHIKWPERLEQWETRLGESPIPGCLMVMFGVVWLADPDAGKLNVVLATIFVYQGGLNLLSRVVRYFHGTRDA